jgi:type IV secretion system protein VirB11
MGESPAAPLLRDLLLPLAPWLDDPATEDVAIQKPATAGGPGECWVFQRGRWSRHDLPLDLAELEAIAILAGALRRQDVDEHSPYLSTELPGRQRLQVCMAPAVPAGTISLTFRRPSDEVGAVSDINGLYRAVEWNRWRREKTARDMTGLLALFDTGDIEPFLAEAVRARLTIAMCGATGSGKTKLAKILLSAISQHERIVTIEDTEELVIANQPNHVRLLYPKDNAEGAVTAEAAIEACLRMRPDRIIPGELRDPNAVWSFFLNGVSGHRGCITTLHGDTPSAALIRLLALFKGSVNGRNWDTETLIRLLAGSIDLIVPMGKDEDIFDIGRVWFVADAQRRGETAADLLREG